MRFNWNPGFAISPHDPRTIYFGANRLFISRDRGESWTATKDLTKALDRNTRLLHQIRRLRKDRPDDAALAALEGPAEERKPLAEEPQPALVLWNGRLKALYGVLQSTDLAPTAQAVRAAEKLLQQSAELSARAEKALAVQ